MVPNLGTLSYFGFLLLVNHQTILHIQASKMYLNELSEKEKSVFGWTGHKMLTYTLVPEYT